MVLLITPSVTGKEVKIGMEIFLSFVVSVAAGVVSYYICKWLDRH